MHPAEEGEAPVPGGLLRYRLHPGAATLPWLVFENGWGASFPHLCYMEQALAPHARLLFYDRAGIGASRRDGAQSARQLTVQWLALLARLRITGPVVLVGQSYGGLMSALHAAQAPDAVRAIVQIDPTPEFSDPLIDRNLGLVRPLTRLMQLCARLRLPEVFFSRGASTLPPEVLRLVVERSFRSVASLEAALDEFRLLPEMRQAIARRDAGSRHPRLVISAAHGATRASWVERRLVGKDGVQAMVERMQALHRRQAQAHAQSRWEPLPHAHGALVMSAPGAAAVADRLVRFIGELGQQAE